MSNNPRLTETYIADLALLTTHELIAKYGGGPDRHQSARKRRGITPIPMPRPGPAQSVQPWHARLGIEPDPVIAASLGYSRSAVSKARILRGIPAVVLPEVAPEWAPLLGTIPDREIARRYNVSATMVQVARNRAGIAPAAHVAAERVAKVRAPRPVPVPAPVAVAPVKAAVKPPPPPEPYRKIDKVKLPRERDFEPTPGTFRPEVLRVGPAVGCVCVGDKTCWWCR